MLIFSTVRILIKGSYTSHVSGFMDTLVLKRKRNQLRANTTPHMSSSVLMLFKL